METPTQFTSRELLLAAIHEIREACDEADDAALSWDLSQLLGVLGVMLASADTLVKTAGVLYSASELLPDHEACGPDWTSGIEVPNPVHDVAMRALTRAGVAKVIK